MFGTSNIERLACALFFGGDITRGCHSIPSNPEGSTTIFLGSLECNMILNFKHMNPHFKHMNNLKVYIGHTEVRPIVGASFYIKNNF